MDSIFFHIDVNSAFLSWTAIDQLKNGAATDLRTIPSIIGGDSSTRHGIVLAKSIPAKKYGIVTAETIQSACRKCPNLTIAKPDHKLYRHMSHLLMEHLSSFCPVIEQVSIDECYMDFTPIAKDFVSPEAAAAIIKDSVYTKFGFTVNVGISDRKVLAKMASDFKKPNLVHTLFVSEIQAKMWPLSISELFMCGKSSQSVLANLGIATIGELATADLSMITAHLKSHGKLLWEFANGIDSSVVEPLPEPAKGVGNSTTLPKDAESPDEIHPVLIALAESVSKRLRAADKLAGTITLELKYNTFQKTSHQQILYPPSNTSQVILDAAESLFEELWNGTPIRLAGIRATKLSDLDTPVQMDLFHYQQEHQKSEKEQKLDQALDSIRGKFGDAAVMRGSLYSAHPSSSKEISKTQPHKKS